MKKFIFVIIALFVYGGMCKAQEMKSSTLLAQKEFAMKTGTAKPSTKALPLKASAKTTNYMLRARNQYRDAGGYLVFDEKGYEMMWPVSVTVDGTAATIKGLINFDDSGYTITKDYDIVGTYDEANKRFVIDTPPYDREKDQSEYTPVGNAPIWGDEGLFVLFTGDWEYIPEDKEYGLETIGRLILKINEDGTLTPEHGFGAAMFFENSYVGFACFFADGNFTPFASGTPYIVTSPAELDVTSKYCYPGATFSYPLRIANASNVNASLGIMTSDDEILVPETTSKSLTGGQMFDTNFQFTPKEVGAYNAIIYVNDGKGNVTQVPFKADVKENPGYEQVVTEGEFTFTTTDDFPFLVTDTITGSPAAVSTNHGDNTVSSLYINFTVPAGCKGALTWKGAGWATMPNYFTAYLDKEQKASVSAFEQEGYEFDEIYALEPGEHVLEFHNTISTDWHELYDSPEVKFYLTNLSLVITSDSPDAAVLNPKELDFGTMYYDRLDVIETKTVDLLNVGTNDLKVLSVTGCENFSALLPEETAETLETIKVPIVFTGTGVGDFSGEVKITTTAGDFVLSCKASCVAIPYDYSPIVKNGTFSFNTSTPYPFEMKGNLACSTTGKDGYNVLGQACWLEADFDVEPGKTVILDWNGYNSSYDFMYFVGQVILTDGTQVYIDDELVYEFAGETSIKSSNVGEDLRVVREGRHSIRFQWVHKSSTPYEGDDIVEISSLSYSDYTGIDTNSLDDAQVVATRWYSVGGMQLNNAPANGIAIKAEVLSDGTSRYSKVIFK